MAWHRPKTNTSLPSSGFGFTLIYLKGYDLLKVYDKRDYFDFDLVNFPFFFFFFFFFFVGGGGGYVLCSATYGVKTSQFIRFIRSFSQVTDLNIHILILTA